jgi:prepilin-type N-terminal cleavage/methylation domain-containing protein
MKRVGAILRSIRRRSADDRGMSLVEVLVSMSIMATVTLIFTSTLASVQRAEVSEEKRTQLNDQARLALQSMDRQIRSGNLLYDPVSEPNTSYTTGADAGYMLRVYTQVNAPTIGTYRCSLWLIDNNKQLLYRWWPPNQPEDASEFRVVTDGIVNRAKGLAAFTLETGNRTIDVTFYVNPDYVKHPSLTQTFSLSITGRNTSFGYPQDVCEDLPAGM